MQRELQKLANKSVQFYNSAIAFFQIAPSAGQVLSLARGFSFCENLPCKILRFLRRMVSISDAITDCRGHDLESSTWRAERENLE
jgi:hypothetical protein